MAALGCSCVRPAQVVPSPRLPPNRPLHPKIAGRLKLIDKRDKPFSFSLSKHSNMKARGAFSGKTPLAKIHSPNLFHLLVYERLVGVLTCINSSLRPEEHLNFWVESSRLSNGDWPGCDILSALYLSDLKLLTSECTVL